MKQHHNTLRTLALAVSVALSGAQAATPGTKNPDHFEFDASLVAPYNAADTTAARQFTLNFNYPGANYLQTVAWRLELVAPNGTVVQRWEDESAYQGRPLAVNVAWAGRVGAASNLPDGIYKIRMSSTVADPVLASTISGDRSVRVSRMLAMARGHDLKQQVWDIRVGNPARPVMPKFNALPTVNAKRGNMTIASAGATASLPYTVYFGNLHSQTNDSDGGGAVSTCSSSQPAQTGQYGPADAFPYAQARGLDFLMTSEHNHYFDGSSGTNTSASAATARSRYQAGLTAAANYNAAHSNFLAIYGMEWGVISNGGHMNIFNSNELFGWEYNASNELLADRFTAKSDYAAIYTTMKTQGLIGQFNHPDASGQFLVGGTSLGYTADGDAVMVAAEILNTSAFSSNTTETETGRSTWEPSFNLMLERGFHVAPVSNQDNHCANWGASFTNRTGVLLPNGTALTKTSMIDALKARRVFATMDKQSQLILTANSHIMGERFSNAGPLTLTANFANTAGRTVSQAQIFEGVPGRNGTVTELVPAASTTITPAVGEHFYYAKVTQDDGNILWSAPVWVTQTSSTGGNTDTTAPTVSASETGTSGTITLSASASDNVGVTRVDLLVDGAVKASKTAAPYSSTLDSTTLSNGSHALVAKAYDAAGNVGTSSSVAFSINNTVADTTPPTVSASESGTSGTITLAATASDNVGVTGVDFLVDNVLKGSDSTTPYAITLDSTTLTNGSHSVIAKAYDAAGNSASSSAVSFSVNNVVATVSMTETESNGTVATANKVATNVSTIKGTMGTSTDKDFFAVALKANQILKVDMVGPTGKDYDLFLMQDAATTLTSSEGSTSTESLTYTNGATAKTVYIKVSSYSGSSTTLQYTLTLTYK